MKLFYTTFIYIIFFLSGSLLPAQTVVFENLHLLTMEEDQLVSSQTVIISDGTIDWVGDAADADIPRNAEVISGDYYLMPGLAEMHAHIPSARQGEEYMYDVLKMYLSQGITTIRGMLGEAAHLELRDRAANSEILSPRIITSGPSFNGNSAPDPQTAREMVLDQAEAGYDFLKLHPGLSLETFNAIVKEAEMVRMPIAGHISYDVRLERTLEAGQSTIDHLDRYMEYLAGEAANREDPNIIYFGYDLTPHVDRSEIPDVARKTAKTGVWNVPTNTLLDNVFNPANSIDVMQGWPGVEYMPERTVSSWINYIENIRESEDYKAGQAEEFLEIRKLLTKALHDAGAGLLLGADAPQVFNPPGFSTHRELKLLVEAGMSPFEALKTGTVNVGEYFGLQEVHGKIAPGYRADLILLSTNPLESIPFRDSIEGVMIRGEFLDRATLDDMLRTIGTD